jgi:hypothetical protein
MIAQIVASYDHKSHGIPTASERLRSEDTVMAFDSAAYSPAIRTAVPTPTAALIDAFDAPCPIWAAENPDRALALLFVAPRDCAAVDVLVSL